MLKCRFDFGVIQIGNQDYTKNHDPEDIGRSLGGIQNQGKQEADPLHGNCRDPGGRPQTIKPDGRHENQKAQEREDQDKGIRTDAGDGNLFKQVPSQPLEQCQGKEPCRLQGQEKSDDAYQPGPMFFRLQGDFRMIVVFSFIPFPAPVSQGASEGFPQPFTPFIASFPLLPRTLRP